jgi:hypothetical protein
MAGGKGISNDPYIITNGVKQSWEEMVMFSWRQS